MIIATTYRQSPLKKFFWVLFVTTVTVLGTWHFRSSHSSGVYPYDPAQDRAFILNTFKDNWYLLISEYSTNYNPEYIIDHRISSTETGTEGDLTISVYREQGKPTGFIAYHMKELKEGYILFVAVDKKARTQGYAQAMIKHALADLKQRGALVVRLATRIVNEPAQKLYTKLGFEKTHVSSGQFVHFEKVLD
jgi:ribosomal protein S18 acetylase RimI-like enzyme